MNTIELQIVRGLLGALAASATAGISYAAYKLKALVDAHVGAKNVSTANGVVDGLASIAENVVAEFNQSVVNDAKASGKFDATFAAKVKADVVAAVKAQASALGVLGAQVAGDVDAAVSSAVEKAVVGAKANGQAVASPAPEASTAPTK